MENSSRFFSNTDCNFYPCHKNIKDLNCLFCYCPFYNRIQCPGSPAFIEKNGKVIKKCSDCTFPHKAENYEKIISLLKESKETFSAKDSFHGGECEQYLQVKHDFSVNINPLGLPAAVSDFLHNCNALAQKYPDRKCKMLIEKIAEKKGFEQKYILAANGASQVISLLSYALGAKRALVFCPTFSGYERALCASGTELVPYFLKEENDFAITPALFDFLKNSPKKIDVIFLCNPNNPTGLCMEKSLLKYLADYCRKENIFLFVDESFIDFVEEKNTFTCADLLKGNDRLILCSAFTKIYAMPGLRLGYAISSNLALLNKMKSFQSEWSVSSIAQEAGCLALSDEEYIRKTLDLVCKQRKFLAEGLEDYGIKVFKSQANFLLFKCKKDIFPSLLEGGILLRSCCNFIGLNDSTAFYFRVAVKTEEENLFLLDAIKDVYCE